MSEDSSPLLSASEVGMAALFGVFFTAIMAFLAPDTSAFLLDRSPATPVGGVVYAVEMTVLYAVMTVVFNALK